MIDPAERCRRPLHTVGELLLRRRREVAKHREHPIERAAIAPTNDRDNRCLRPRRALEAKAVGVADWRVAGHIGQVGAGGFLEAHYKRTLSADRRRDAHGFPEQETESPHQLVSRGRHDGRCGTEDDDGRG